MRDSIINDREYLSTHLGEVLRGVEYPLYHLDFETFAAAIPRFSGTRPYDQIPFQYSVHKETQDGTLSHHEFLASGDADPRPGLASALVETLSKKGFICTYSHYERRVIRALALDVPALAGPLESILERSWDLHAVIRAHDYHPKIHGSFSIKQVVPALLPGSSYAGLAINDGRMAAVAYEQRQKTHDVGERNRLHEALREYCAQDTLSMVELRRSLLKKSRSTACASTSVNGGKSP